MEKKITVAQQGVVVYSFNPSTEAEGGGCL